MSEVPRRPGRSGEILQDDLGKWPEQLGLGQNSTALYRRLDLETYRDLVSACQTAARKRGSCINQPVGCAPGRERS